MQRPAAEVKRRHCHEGADMSLYRGRNCRTHGFPLDPTLGPPDKDLGQPTEVIQNASAQFLNPAGPRECPFPPRLCTLRGRGLIAPVARHAARLVDEMACVAEIAALRELGLSLAQVGRVSTATLRVLSLRLPHQAVLEGRVQQLAGAVS